jgi:hypothetical protein
MNIKESLKRIHTYIGTQSHSVTPHTISKRVGIQPKQARYLVRTYFRDAKQKGNKTLLVYLDDFNKF